MTYLWSVKVILKNGRELIGEYETERLSSNEVFDDLMYEDDGFEHQYIRFVRSDLRQLVYVAQEDISALILTAPVIQ